MTTFDKREKGFEKKFQRDKDLEFRAMARRNKLLGLWAAEFLGLEGDAADAYAREVVQSDFDEPGDEDVFRKVFGDLQDKGADVADHRLRKQMEILFEEALEQVRGES